MKEHQKPRVGTEQQRPKSSDLIPLDVSRGYLETKCTFPKGPSFSWSPRFMLLGTSSGNRLGSNLTLLAFNHVSLDKLFSPSEFHLQPKVELVVLCPTMWS
jgi:hypothetical protein